MLGHRLAPALALLSAFTAATSAFAQAAALVDPRLREPLNTGWSFHKGSLDPAQATASTPPDTIQWQQISLPHTWNAQDGQDGGGNYFRGAELATNGMELARLEGLRSSGVGQHNGAAQNVHVKPWSGISREGGLRCAGVRYKESPEVGAGIGQPHRWRARRNQN